MFEVTDFDSDVRIQHYVTNSLYQFGLHLHTVAYEIVLFIRGEVIWEVEGHKQKLSHGDIVFVAPGEIHRPHILDESDYERIVIHLSQSTLMELSTAKTAYLQLLENNKVHFTSYTEEEMALAEQYTKKISQYQSHFQQLGSDVLYTAWMNIFLMQLCNKLYESVDNTVRNAFAPPIVMETIDYITANLTEKISVSNITEHLNVSRTYLNQLFKKWVGYSIWDYVIYKRLAFSQKLILTGKSITDACFQSGFNDYSHYIKTFTKVFGISPGRFNRQFSLYNTLAISQSDVDHVDTAEHDEEE